MSRVGFVCVPPRILVRGPSGAAVRMCNNCYEEGAIPPIEELSEESADSDKSIVPEEVEVESQVIQMYEILSITAGGVSYSDVTKIPDDAMVRLIVEREIVTGKLSIRQMKDRLLMKDLRMLFNDDRDVLDEFTEKIIDKKE
jgi:hypothetical protein